MGLNECNAYNLFVQSHTISALSIFAVLFCTIFAAGTTKNTISVVQQMWTSSLGYDESGPSIVHRKYSIPFFQPDTYIIYLYYLY